MALMPEDLQNQRFTPVRFSEGYDMDEVDNFLDNDVEPRLKELIAENERLKKELEEAHSRIAELETGETAVAPAADVSAAGESDAIIDTTPVTDADGRVTQYIGVQADVTARVEAERALVTEQERSRRYAAQLARLDAQLGGARVTLAAQTSTESPGARRA